MARLPVVGDDDGAWGTVLNEFLEVAHNPDGTLSASAGGVEHNVDDYGATGDGSTDDSGAIQDAIDAAYDAGGGIVLIPGSGGDVGSRYIINTTLEMRTGVWLKGLGSATSLAGSANPMIIIDQVDSQDRITISDLFLQDPDGVGIKLEVSGAFQLGWPRVIVQNVTVADAVSHAFWLVAGVIECRLINCVSMRAGGSGILSEATDNFFIGCTTAEGAGSGLHLQGGNNKVSACKAYSNDQYGFLLEGAGRHMLSSCESQDNTLAGFRVNSHWNSLAAVLADTDGTAGIEILGDNNTVNGSFMRGGGGTGQATKVGVLFSETAMANIVSGVSNAVTLVGGKAEGNTVNIQSAAGSRKQITYTSPWTPLPYDAEIQAMTLTGNLTLVNPIYKHVGQKLTLELRQDGTGGRTVTFPNEFRTSWTPSTTATHLNIISFEYDGTAWQQTGSVVGLTAKPSIGKGDTFNRANEVLGTSSSGHTWELHPSSGAVWNVVSNQAKTIGSGSFQTNIAVLDAGVPDFTAQVTVVTQTQETGLVFRYVDQNNYFLVGGPRVYKMAAGVGTQITGSLLLGNGDVITVVASGPNYFIYENATLVFTFADTDNVSGTKAGIFSSNDADILDAFTIV